MIAFEAGLAQILAKTLEPRVESILLYKAAGRITAAQQMAAIDVPSVDNSAMDGYAVRCADFEHNNTFTVSQRIAAGDLARALEPKSVARIFTGAMIPAGADAVILQEDSQPLVESNQVTFTETPSLGQHIRLAGQDIQYQSEVVAKGHRLSAGDIGLLASVGVSKLQCYRPLTVAFFSTANANWGNASSVLVGDFVYSKAFELLVAIGSLPVMDVLSHSTTKIAEGEVKQLMLIGDLSLSQDDYFEVIHNKTAVLFSGSCRCAAMIADTDSETEHALALYGLHLGQAFQIFDDYLDYTGTADNLGKNVGDDLAEGKLTLPLIEALRLTTNTQDNSVLRRIIEEKDLSDIETVVALCRSSGALDYTLTVAHSEANKAKQALAILPQSNYRDALSNIADQAVHRKQ